MAFLCRNLMVGTASYALAVGLPMAGHAHAIESTINYLDGELQLHSSFSTGDAAAGATVGCCRPMAAPARSWARWMPTAS